MARVLLVESDVVLAKNLAGALKVGGHEVVFTVDAQAAVTAADATTPDLIILDLMLAGRSGTELLYELRSYADWQAIPVVIYSGLHPSELPAACLAQLGVKNVFYKPTAKISDLVSEANRLTAVVAAA